MRSLLSAALLALTAVLAGCQYDCYLVEITPQGESFQRRLTCWHEESGGEKIRSSSVSQAELQRLGKIYPTRQATDGTGRTVFSGTFSKTTPADVGGAGSYTHWTSSLGSTSAYVERFRGNDDLEAELSRRRVAVDQLADLVLGWFELEMGRQSDFVRLKRFLNDDLRQDLKNLAAYAWLSDAMAGPMRKPTAEFPLRFAQYLVERGYAQPADVPSLSRAAMAHDADRLVQYVQRVLARKMGVRDAEAIPNSLAFLSDAQEAQGRLSDYVRTTELFKQWLKQRKEEHRDKPRAKEPTPGDFLGELMGQGVLHLELFASADILKVKLACANKPFDTNGTWDSPSKRVAWSASLTKGMALPAVLSLIHI